MHVRAYAEPGEPFKCPKCGRTSYNPNDRFYGYCGACEIFVYDLQLADVDVIAAASPSPP